MQSKLFLSGFLDKKLDEHDQVRTRQSFKRPHRRSVKGRLNCERPEGERQNVGELLHIMQKWGSG
jgi:hypothetical protein